MISFGFSIIGISKRPSKKALDTSSALNIKEQTEADTSLNYLGAKALETAGIKTYAYQNFLRELEEQYPVISSMQVQKADGAISSAAAEEEGLRLYQSIQYYYLFDYKE